jgi:ABC-type branched-subunit amino acid transport system ATPase component
MLIKWLTFDGLRGFQHFEMPNLGRINLIVGTNNCGKTTVLEAVQMLIAEGDVSAMWSVLTRRGEELWDEGDRRARSADVRRLFNGHQIALGSRFSIQGLLDDTKAEFTAKVRESLQGQNPNQSQLFEFETERAPVETELFIQPAALALEWKGRTTTEAAFELNSRGGLTLDSLRRASSPVRSIERSVTRFITAAALSTETVIEYFEDIVLTPEENLVIEALRIIEPTIERLASSGGERLRSAIRPGARGGMLVRCTGVQNRIPIGSMGDGIWRMLGLALSLVQTENGILLIDEIDTGLHYSVMSDMWKLVYATAKRLNVQVFATTHSRDCYESLAVICRSEVSNDSEVTIQRLERGKAKAIQYSEQEIVAAAERGMEVR